MKPKKVEIYIGKVAMKRLQKIVDMATDHNAISPKKSFMLQVYDDGRARGICFDYDTAKAAQKHWLKVWEKSEWAT